MTKTITVENLSKQFVIHHEAKASREEEDRSSFASRLSGLFGSSKRQGADEAFWALKDVNFEVKEGERLAIIGRNGAGKSTLLKILSRVVAPTTGRIQINGRLASLLEVGTGFHPDLTGRENIYLNGAIMGMSRAEVRRKFDAIVDFSEIERFLDTPVKRYSSGMYVRLAFAVSAFLEPDIVVLDEVLSVGDAAFQKKSYDKMRELAAGGRTVIFVSHSMSAVKELCETAIFMEHGRASEKTKVADAVGNYLRYVNSNGNANLPYMTGMIDLLSIEVSQRGVTTRNFTLDGGAPIHVGLTFRSHLSLDRFRIGFYIKTQLGEMILRALAADWVASNESVEPGIYRATATIPADFLVPGDYVLEVHSSEFGVRDFFASEVLQPFRVSQSERFNRQNAREQAFGYVHLQPDWRIDRLPD